MRTLLSSLLAFFTLAGCDDTLYGKPDSATTLTGDSSTTDSTDTHTTDTGPLAQDFCGVQSIFNQTCVVCHGATNPSAGLDLRTDPYTAIVNVASSMYGGATLVVPGSSATSLLYTKMAGTQTGSQGEVMPTTGSLSADKLAVVQVWIDAGASPECNGTIETGTTGGYHPPGFDDPAQHGMDAKCQADTCTTCHGTDLAGGTSGVDCDSCHEANWKTDCTWCHGKTDNTTGAPPVDIDNSTSGLSFPEHTQHVEQTIHAAWDCTQCHTKPTDALSPGHFLIGDATACAAEVTFSAGLSSRGTYAGSGSCSNLYCHSNGQSTSSTGSATTGRTLSCDGCHGAASNGGRGLSGKHDDHFEEGVDCNECHAATLSNNTTVSNPANHVDGEKDVSFAASGMTYSGGRCTGSCHGEGHSNESW